MHRNPVPFLLSATIFSLISFWNPDGAAAQATAASDSPVQFAFVTNNPSDYWTICRKGVEKAARDLPGVKVRFVMPDDGTAATQRNGVDDLVAKGVKGIAISPVDPDNETDYLSGVAAKVNLITTDTDAPRSKRLCYIGTDNHAAGLMAGKLIRRALPHGGSIMLFVGLANAQNARERIQGITDALRGSRVRIIGVRTDDTDHARAETNAADALVQYPQLAGMVGIWSYNGPTLFSAVRHAHKIGRVKIVAFDEEAATLGGVQSGAIYATVVQQPYEFGYQSVCMLSRLAKGNTSGVPAGRRLIIPTLAITRSNLTAYKADRDKKLHDAR